MDNHPMKQEADDTEQGKRTLLTFKKFIALARKRKLAAKKRKAERKVEEICDS